MKEIRRLNASVIAQSGCGLNFFKKDAMQERDRALMRACGYDPDEVDRFDKSSTGVKNDLFKQELYARDLIRKAIPALVKCNRIAVQFDHQQITHLRSETGPKAFGAGLILTGADKLRHIYLCGFVAVPDATDATTHQVLKSIAQVRFKHRILFALWSIRNYFFQEFGFWKELSEGRIPIITDSQLKGVAASFGGLVQICNWHSVQCQPKRASDQTLAPFDEKRDEKWKVSQSDHPMR